ncbi:metal ABC transporter substrate-binding protein [Trueperella bialowiezensis]|uniref:Tromp-1 n=1 Tax=Trueperella bialowiezensis TaxID=312285 RepID=A0A3S4VBQ2_9ACTO|nr:zinc ABC transporter substrate-binding protein [Trueperella bialowiezensis]VEI13983.1 Tromp-1 [Trueperella bialowiezensis]
MKKLFALLAASALALSACSSDKPEAESTDTKETTAAAEESSLKIYATTGYIADAAKNIAPDAEVITMVGPGGDPHTYTPSTKDIEAMRDSDIVFSNGLHLEAQMEDQLASLGDAHLAVGETLPKSDLLPWEDNTNDPHVWNSPDLWSQVVDAMTDKIAEEDPDNADKYRENAEKYKADIDATHKEAKEKLDKVKEPRILITGHDAFEYFGKTYDLDVHATDFISTEAEISATEMSELADLIANNKVPVIFMDNTANPQAIESLKEAVHSRGWDVKVSDVELFADTLGESAPTDTYLGVLEHNSSAVAKELS